MDFPSSGFIGLEGWVEWLMDNGEDVNNRIDPRESPTRGKLLDVILDEIENSIENIKETRTLKARNSSAKEDKVVNYSIEENKTVEESKVVNHSTEESKVVNHSTEESKVVNNSARDGRTRNHCIEESKTINHSAGDSETKNHFMEENKASDESMKNGESRNFYTEEVEAKNKAKNQLISKSHISYPWPLNLEWIIISTIHYNTYFTLDSYSSFLVHTPTCKVVMRCFAELCDYEIKSGNLLKWCDVINDDRVVIMKSPTDTTIIDLPCSVQYFQTLTAALNFCKDLIMAILKYLYVDYTPVDFENNSLIEMEK